MEILIALLSFFVAALFARVWWLGRQLKEKTFLIIEDDGMGGKIIKNHKGEKIFEL